MADETMAEETIRWFAGIDWGSAKHQACLLDRAGRVVGERAFAHGGAGLAALCDWLVSMAGDPSLVAVAIEVPHGPVVDALLDRGFAVYAINPKQLDRLRDRVSVAGAKDDRRDARVAAAGLRTDPHLFRRVLAGNPSVIELREWSRLAEELQRERARLGNRVRQQLWRYDPQLLALSDDVTAERVLALWSMAPTPAQAARLREATLARLLRQHRIRKLDAPAVLAILRQPAIPVAPGVTEAAVLHLRSLVARLRLANQEFGQPGVPSGRTQARGALHGFERDRFRCPEQRARTAGLVMRPSFDRCPGSARSRSPPCSPRPPGRSRVGTTQLSGPSRAWHP
jgi:Transposase